MNAFYEQVQMLHIISDKLSTKEISLDAMPEQTLEIVIHNILLMLNEDITEIASIYDTLLIDFYNEKNNYGVAKLLDLLAYYLTIYNECNSRYFEEKKENRKLMCKYSYMKNKEKIYQYYKKNVKSSENFFLGKGVVYTAIMGNYDKIHVPQVVDRNLDYILFTDNPNMVSDFWKIRLVETDDNECDNETKKARKIKILGYRYLNNYDYSIWIDGDTIITGDILEYIKKYKGSEPIICANHPQFDCIYQEAELCKRLKKDNELAIQKQVETYKKEGYPINNGLIASGFIVREMHNNSLNFLMDQWWEEVSRGSIRDQLSFNYVFWKYNTMYDTSDIEIWDNKYITFIGHERSGEMQDEFK